MPRETFYDEVEIEDFKWDPEAKVFHYPCPCGDRFEISKSQLRDGDEVARCPSCSLIIRVIYEWDDFEDYDSEEEGEGAEVDGEDAESFHDAVEGPEDEEEVIATPPQAAASAPQIVREGDNDADPQEQTSIGEQVKDNPEVPQEDSSRPHPDLSDDESPGSRQEMKDIEQRLEGTRLGDSAGRTPLDKA